MPWAARSAAIHGPLEAFETWDFELQEQSFITER